ncbi:MAG: amidase, partial [Acidobacteriaceae bacterium]
MAKQIRLKKISPIELVEAHLNRIEKLNPKLNAFVQVDSERVLRQARDAEAALMRKNELGPLHGVPISIKSSIDVAGMRCEAGTRLRAGHIAQTDAPLVARLRRAGAIILGVTNTPELLMAWETDNLLYGRTNNPWDVSRTAGGSSGGEAAAIASGCSAGGVGSDGGGSIRVPAHFCGICGLKPTPGRIPATGHYPQSAGPFALLGVVGPMARTVADLKLLFGVMQGPDIGDPSAAPVPVRWPNASALKKTRIGYFEDDGRTPVTPETRSAVRKAAEALCHAGFEVVPFRPDGLEKARQLWWKIFGVAGGMLLGPLTRGRESELSPILKEFNGWVGAETPHTAQSLLDTWINRDLLRMEMF